MSYDKTEYSALIVSSSEKTTQYLTELLKECRVSLIISTSSAEEAKRRLIDENIDFVIINSPLPDDFGVQLALDISERGTYGILIIVKGGGELYEQVSLKVEDFGILTLARPCTKQTLFQTLKLMIATKAKMKDLETKAMSLQEKMDEIRIVNRAKWVLIDQLRMSESEAHRYIEKTAMDACVKRRDVAERIINTYEN